MILQKYRNKLYFYVYKWRIRFAPFYKRHKKENKISLTQKNGRGVIDFDLGFFYNRIPKAANTSIVVSLAENKYGRKFDTGLEAKKTFKFTPAHLSKKQVNEFDALFKFTFVRNPYTRVLSAYLEKIVNKKKRINSLEEIPSFHDFLDYLKMGGLYADAHWAPQASLLLIPVEDFDFIGKVENMENDHFYILKHIFQKPALSKYDRCNKHKTGSADKLKVYYDEYARNAVNDLYEDDFNVFGYDTRLEIGV